MKYTEKNSLPPPPFSSITRILVPSSTLAWYQSRAMLISDHPNFLSHSINWIASSIDPTFNYSFTVFFPFDHLVWFPKCSSQTFFLDLKFFSKSLSSFVLPAIYEFCHGSSRKSIASTRTNWSSLHSPFRQSRTSFGVEHSQRRKLW